MEENIEFLYRFDPRFPIADVVEIGRRLTQSRALVPGWIEPSEGAFDIRAVIVSRHLDGWDTVLLPDRNIVSRMARVAREGAITQRDHPMEIAALLMAFAQAVDFEIDPGLAFHELGQQSSNAAAVDELRWFRAADEGGRALEWINLALNRTSVADLPAPAPSEELDFSARIRRWSCNYAAVLKMAELELTPSPPLNKLLSLLDWMMSDFLLAGPAFVFAARYWAPNLPRAGLIKQVRAPNRERALAGARNAAWDICYLSEFARRIVEGEPQQKRFILATADRLLAEIAPLLLMGDARDEAHPSFEEGMAHWWPQSSAFRISNDYFAAVEDTKHRNRWSEEPRDPVQRLIAEGEAFVRQWRG